MTRRAAALRRALTFIVAIDAQVGAPAAWQVNDPAALIARRQYVTAVVRQRLHQRGFRERVLRAYQQCCAICRLRHDALLEAAHTLPDIHLFDEPVVPNGLALCKLHHAAFDAYIIGVTPDLEVTVRLDVLQEIDGPMLQHGLQGSGDPGRALRPLPPRELSGCILAWTLT